jgi:hypothetical protein
MAAAKLSMPICMVVGLAAARIGCAERGAVTD